MNSLNKRIIGSKYENLAMEFLVDKGYKILDRNFRCRLGEIDIIAQSLSDKTIIFCEVKYRKTDFYGNSLEAVNYKKRNTIRKVAGYYLIKRFNSTEIPCRFDVIGIDNCTITHIENAF